MGIGYNRMRLCSPVRSKGALFNGVVPTSLTNEDVHVLCSEVKIMLAKRAIEVVPPSQASTGLLPRPKKGQWSQTHPKSKTSEPGPNKALIQNYFETDPLADTPRDWFFSLDLKDVFFTDSLPITGAS